MPMHTFELITVADPGFPRGGGANPLGVPTCNFAKFFQKLYEIEKNWTPRGVRVPRTPSPRSQIRHWTNQWLQCNSMNTFRS